MVALQLEASKGDSLAEGDARSRAAALEVDLSLLRNRAAALESELGRAQRAAVEADKTVAEQVRRCMLFSQRRCMLFSQRQRECGGLLAVTSHLGS